MGHAACCRISEPKSPTGRIAWTSQLGTQQENSKASAASRTHDAASIPLLCIEHVHGFVHKAPWGGVILAQLGLACPLPTSSVNLAIGVGECTFWPALMSMSSCSLTWSTSWPALQETSGRERGTTGHGGE